jgi:hypothetical protein
MRHRRGVAYEIPPAALCEIEIDSNKSAVLVDIAGFPKPAEAVLLTGKLFLCGITTERYMTLFKAYECLAAQPAIEWAGVRHGLSHASATLSRPKTVEVLKRLFETTRIDLSRSSHRRVFYRQFVTLLKETDTLLADGLMSRQAGLRLLCDRTDALHDWQVDGIPGIAEPMRVLQERPKSAHKPSNRPLQPTAGVRLPFESDTGAAGRG